ncbi:hypothetical protein D9615_008995 [Tricholomella constricta]|uniref:Uncharacterized protein n=1 Tax=Tricholomella constricta TaxID=117010 RepID=A0A8H5H0H8_9AGAR|nr:hypothetical protein D9615_008995 [Tricholomella constricta]
MAEFRPYSGAHRKLLIALDIGTTFSGQVPQIKGVTRFPAQEHVGGDSKVPSIIYYKDSEFLAAGAEAANIVEDLEDVTGGGKTCKSFTRAEWFKLHMRPNPKQSLDITQSIPPLPLNNTIVGVFADFLGYLYRCALTYIRDTHLDGVGLLKSVENHIEFVLTHPNAWEGAQQAQLRQAAIRGGLVPNLEEGNARIHFVTEGEAGLHFCIRRGLSFEAMKRGEGILIVDAGGGTVDLSAYGQVTSVSEKQSFHEITAPQCIFKGSVFVTKNAYHYLRNRLRGSTFAADVDHITRCFDDTAKLRFRNSEEPQYIKFGRTRDNDLNFDIRSGQIKIPGEDVAAFFEPCIEGITQAILKQKMHATKSITSIFLIGGFSASDWLYSRLKLSLKPLGLELLRPDGHVNKAVADGAVSFYIDHFVKARVSKFTYGLDSYVPYDITNVEHRRRLATLFVDSDGVDNVQRKFSPILKKGTEVKETTEFREDFFRKADSLDAIPNPMMDDILCYRGPSTDPQWTDVESDMYTRLCTVVSDTSRIKRSLRPKRGKEGKVYFHLKYEVILSFGLTELKAQYNLMITP